MKKLKAQAEFLEWLKNAQEYVLGVCPDNPKKAVYLMSFMFCSCADGCSGEPLGLTWEGREIATGELHERFKVECGPNPT